MEGLSVASSIIAVIQISDRVITLCREFVGKVRGADKEIFHMINTITALKGILQFLQTFVDEEENHSRLPLLHSLCQRSGPFEKCHMAIAEIELKLRHSKRDYTGALKAITWPWKWKDIGPILEDIEKQKTLMLLAIQGDTTRTILTIENKVNDINSHFHTQEDIDIVSWLSKADPSTNHNAACEKRQEGTGAWFLSSVEFSSWALPKRSLWLHGIPGAGKTVLCSTIIENVKARFAPDAACLYFYFDFNDSQKQDAINMLYSFLAQLSSSEIPNDVKQLYKRCNLKSKREPTVSELLETVLSIADNGRRMFIIIDALDESSNWKALFGVIKTILGSGKEINLLMTSRKEYDIQAGLEKSVDSVVAIQDRRVDSDVELYVRQCLQTDPDLCQWDDELKSEIATRVTSGAHGM